MITEIIRPQSKFFMKTLFQRDYDMMTVEKQKLVDKFVIALDIVIVLALFWWL